MATIYLLTLNNSHNLLIWKSFFFPSNRDSILATFPKMLFLNKIFNISSTKIDFCVIIIHSYPPVLQFYFVMVKHNSIAKQEISNNFLNRNSG